MLSAIVGPVDLNSAIVLSILFITLCVVITTVIRRRSKTDLHNEFELAKIRLHNEDENNKRNTAMQRDRELGKLAVEKEIEFKRIDGNMITSHARTSAD